MNKVKIKRSPKKGDQVAFGLVSNLVQPLGNTSGEREVSNTMRAIPRNEANVEVEGGETVIGDPNNDGLMEFFSFQGKRHSEGGMPVNLPPGSFIFSDTKKLKIKDQDLLSKVFNLSYKKGGYTPAEISKRYQINKYIDTIKDKDADAISKRSASEMIKKNTEKLGILALVQESMKGFPDGVPEFAQSAMAGLQGGMPQEEQMPQADFGGYMPLALKNGGGLPLPKYQGAGKQKSQVYTPPSVDKTGRRNNTPGWGAAPIGWNEEYFAKTYPVEYQQYRKALDELNQGIVSNTTTNLINHLASEDIQGSVGWLPWTDQDKFQDLGAILLERKQAIENKSKGKPTGIQNFDTLVNQVFTSYKNSPEGSLKQAEYERLLEKLKKFDESKYTAFDPAYRSISNISAFDMGSMYPWRSTFSFDNSYESDPAKAFTNDLQSLLKPYGFTFNPDSTTASSSVTNKPLTKTQEAVKNSGAAAENMNKGTSENVPAAVDSVELQAQQQHIVDSTAAANANAAAKAKVNQAVRQQAPTVNQQRPQVQQARPQARPVTNETFPAFDPSQAVKINQYGGMSRVAVRIKKLGGMMQYANGGIPKYQQGTAGTTDENDAWIKKILEFEACCGSASGTGLGNFGYNNWKKLGHDHAPTSLDEAIQYYKQDYLPKVAQYPLGVRERLGDYIYNTNRSPEDLLLHAAGIISLDQINSPSVFTKEWNDHKNDIEKLYTDPNFLSTIDDKKIGIYKTTPEKHNDGTITHYTLQNPNPAFENSWKYRINLFKNNSQSNQNTSQNTGSNQSNVSAPPATQNTQNKTQAPASNSSSTSQGIADGDYYMAATVNGVPGLYKYTFKGGKQIGQPVKRFNVSVGNKGLTPTGKSPDYAGTFNDFNNTLKDMQAAGLDLSKINSAADLQAALYDEALKRDPSIIENMWSGSGMTKHGASDPTLRSELEALGVKTTSKGTGYTLDFSGVSPENKAKALSVAKRGYTDNLLGLRGLTLLNTPTKEKPPGNGGGNDIPETPPSDIPETPPGGNGGGEETKQKEPGQKNYYYCTKDDGIRVVTVRQDEDAFLPPPPTGTVSGPYESEAEAEFACSSGDKTITRKGSWFLPDIVNFAGAMGQKVAKRQNYLPQITLEQPDFVTESWVDDVAALQENLARSQNQIENTAAGNVGLATYLGGSGKSLRDISQAISNVDTRNVGIANTALDRAAQIKNQERSFNVPQLANFVGRENENRLARTRAYNERGQNIINAFNQGWSNMYNANLAEQMTPQMNINRLTGEVAFSGQGRNPFLPDTYQNPYFAKSNSFASPSEYASLYGSTRDALKTVGNITDEDELDKITSSYLSNYLKNRYNSADNLDLTKLMRNLNQSKRGGQTHKNQLPSIPFNFNDYFSY